MTRYEYLKGREDLWHERLLSCGKKISVYRLLAWTRYRYWRKLVNNLTVEQAGEKLKRGAAPKER